VAHKVTLIPGDGIGPEVSAAAVRVLEATGVQFEWESFAAGADAFAKYHEYIPKELVDSVERTRIALKGPVTTPIGGGFSSINVQLRRQFELYCNFRPIRNLPGVPTRYPGVDLIIIRENTEGLYRGIEHEVVPGVVESLKIVTEKACTRISRWAFEYARRVGRKKITAIHKANIMKLSDGLFIRCSRQVSKDYPEISYGEHIVDNTCMQLVTNPYQYDMLLMENLYGDIVSDLCAAFVGGLGLVPGANFGSDCAIFEAVHGSAPDIAGRGIANPTALVRSAILMLRHLGEKEAAEKVKYAVHFVYREGRHITRDMGGSASTDEFADAVIEAMESPAWREQAAKETNPV
jgi:isocitrate dehydrogenase (NAD+)